MTSVSINIPQLLDFFDSNENAKKDSSAVKGVVGEEMMLALLVEYFRRAGVSAEVETRVCKGVGLSGYRLDAWVKAFTETSKTFVYYQVEVKCWSAHGVGGGSWSIPTEATENELAVYRKKVWNAYWSGNGFRIAGLNKVLTPMHHPKGVGPILPLACLWAPMHPEGQGVSMFSRSLTGLAFPEVCVFSASSFLRSLEKSEPTLRLELPHFSSRMSWFSKLFEFAEESRSAGSRRVRAGDK